MSQKYDPPAGPPPPAYGSEAATSNISSPAAAHVQPHHTGQSQPQSDYYNASPYQAPAHSNQPYPDLQQGPGYPPSQGGYPPQGQNGYYGNPQMGYAPQGGYYGPQGAYGPQAGYGQGGYAPGYGPQGQYLDQRRGGGAGEGFLGACLGALACCCCLDLLF